MKLLDDLISIPSLSGQEEKIQQYIFRTLKKMEYKPVIIDGNVVLRIAGVNRKKTLIFNAHVDTVPAGDSAEWQDSPFKGTIRKGRMYGLGASDEKSAVAVQLLLAEFIQDTKPACDIWLTFVTQEEVDGSGTARFVEWFQDHHAPAYEQVAAILGEPTDCAYIGIGHKGNVFLQIETRGNSGHGSNPEVINNHAVLNMYRVIRQMQQLGNIWEKKYKDSLLGVPTVGIATSIRAGSTDAPNKFPDICIATFDIRTTPALHKKVQQEVVDALNDPTIRVTTVFPPAGAGFTKPTSHIVEIFQAITKKPYGVFQGATDQCFFTEGGIQSVIFGPGDSSVMHTANEYVTLKNITECLGIYKKVVTKF
jgi:acetylornithine deacetylase